MARRPTERELLATLSAAVESDDGDEELAALLQEHAGTIAASLGMSTTQLANICKAPPMDRTVKVRVALRRFRERHAESLKRQAENLSIAAANMLVGLSRWHEERVELDARIVLGKLLADHRKAIRFEVEGRNSVTILRDKLKEAAKALTFSDLRSFLDDRGLNFRWHGERGGLLLVSQSVEKFESSAVLTVEFPRPQQKAKPSLVRPSPMTPSAAWLGDVLLDLGFA